MKNMQPRLPLFPLIWAILSSCIARDVLSYGWQPRTSTTSRKGDAIIPWRLPTTYRAMIERACTVRCISLSTTTKIVLTSKKEINLLHMSSSSYYDEESDSSSSYTKNAKRNKPKNRKNRSQILQRLHSLMKRNSNNPLQSFWEQVTKIGYIFVNRFKALPRKIQIVLTIQLFAVSLLLGGASKRTYDYFISKSGTAAVGSSRAIPLKREKPVEVYYSTFLDLVEKSGKGHTPGKNPAILLEDVQIGEDKISFQVKQDEAKHAVALQQLLQQRNSNKKRGNLVDNDDVSIKQIKTTKAFVKRIKDNENIIAKLRQSNIPFRAMEKQKQTFKSIVSSAGLIFYIFILLRIYRSMNMGGGSADTPGKWANAEQLSTVSFDEIQGMDMQKYEVMELVDSLRNPMKYSTIGARPPRGLLLVGPPGCGKTLLARAVATSAGVPLLYCSGSDFVEMFVGRGAARVRKTFARAAKLAPCIVFIDEIDALGKSRSFGGLNSNRGFNDEAEQTLNQLLACMDGLSSVKGVIVLAATNRKEVLDPALVRPGRFDRIVEVDLPDAKGRERILRVHASKLKGFTEGKGIDESRPGSMGKGYAVDLMAVSLATPGLSGAELEFVVNEAAINAVRRLSSSMKEKKGSGNISSTPRILPTDFEASVKNFYKTRRPPSMKGLIENVFGTKV